MDIEPGQLDRTEGVVERGGRVAARIVLRDDRKWNAAKVRIPGAPDGEKLTHIDGTLAIRFIEKDDDELSDHLNQIAAREERIVPLSFDIQLDDGRHLEGCSIAGPLGGRNGAFWFILDT